VRKLSFKYSIGIPLLSVTIWFLWLLISAPVCGGQESQTSIAKQNAASFAGCYDLRLARWWPWAMGKDTALVTPPERIQLELERGNRSFEKDKLLIRQIPLQKESRRSSYWLPEDKNEVLLIWTDGFSGVSLRLTRNGNKLHGWAHAHFDFPRPPHVAHVTAELISCATAP
jgi:hypothetical protein